jgi:hypothetical protein
MKKTNTPTTAPTYTVWANDIVAQTNADSALRFFRFDWVSVWAKDGDTAEAIVRDMMDTAWQEHRASSKLDNQ